MKANCYKRRCLLVASLCVLLSASCSCSSKHEGKDAEPEPVDTTAVLTTRIQQCSRLYTTECQVRKITVYRDTAALSGKVFGQDFRVNLPMGKKQIAIPVSATLKAYIDFDGFSADNVRRNGHRIEIILPDPQVMLTATEIDHDGVRQNVDLLRSKFSDEEVTRIQGQGRDAIIRDLVGTGKDNQTPPAARDIIENARRCAAIQIVPIVERMGYKEADITVTFRNDVRLTKIQNG